MKINIQYIDTCYPYNFHYVFVKVIQPPKIVGHKALKNIDFIDHDYWPEKYAYYKQVTERQIMDKYSKLSISPVPKYQSDEKDMNIGKKIIIKPILDSPIKRIPIVGD